MYARVSHMTGGVVAALLLASLAAPAHADEQQFTLAGAVPNDVYICVAGQHNPEREFLHEYWGEVLDALKQSGVGGDLLELIDSFLDAEQKAEVERLKQRASQLLAGVDWEELAGKEMVFAERLAPPMQGFGQRPPMLLPEIVGIFRGSSEGAARNFDGLTAILEGIVEEINRALGAKAMLAVDRNSRMGAEVAGIVMSQRPGGGPEIAVTLTDSGAKELAQLTSENMGRKLAIVFDGKLLCTPGIKAQAGKYAMIAGDFTPTEAEKIAAGINAAAADATPATEPRLQCRLVAQDGVPAPADEFPDPHDPTGQTKIRVLRDVLLDESAVKSAQVSSPKRTPLPVSITIAHRDDLVFIVLGEQMLTDVLGLLDGSGTTKALADDRRFKAAFAKLPPAEDSMVFFNMQALLKPVRALVDMGIAAIDAHGDVYRNTHLNDAANELNHQAIAAYLQGDTKQALALTKQAHDAAPNDSAVLYNLACFNALLGNKSEALTWLDKAVDAGFQAPGKIAEDSDLVSLRDDPRFQAILVKAAKAGAQQATEKTALVKRLVDRLMNAVEILDYVATVEFTDGYAVRTESIAVLVSDAQTRPIYPVFGNGDQLTDFDRYLPQETMSFSVSGGFDPGELYKFIEDTFRVVGPKGEELLAKWAAIQEEFGIDVKKDVIGWIDGNLISVTLADGGGSVWLIKVTDEETAREKVTAAVGFLSTKLAEVMATNPALAMLAVHTSPTQDERLTGFENLHFAMSPQPIVWGVTDGHLVFGSSADAVALCLETARGEHPGIRENARVMSEALVPAGPFTSVALTDQRGLGDKLAAGIGMVSMMSGMLTMAIPDPEVRPVITKIAGMLAKLTPVARKIDFYKSTATCTTFDGRSWYTRMVTHYVSPTERSAGKTQ